MHVSGLTVQETLELMRYWTAPAFVMRDGRLVSNRNSHAWSLLGLDAQCRWIVEHGVLA